MSAIRFLVADDNAAARRLLKALLETREGWAVCGEAENGIEAAAKASEVTPDVIILDLAMPLMDGLHAAQAIHRTLPYTPILLYTMHNFSGLEQEAQRSGIRKVISKTDPAEALLAAVEDSLKAVPPGAPDVLPQMSSAAGASSNGVENPPAAEGNSELKPS